MNYMVDWNVVSHVYKSASLQPEIIRIVFQLALFQQHSGTVRRYEMVYLRALKS